VDEGDLAAELSKFSRLHREDQVGEMATIEMHPFASATEARDLAAVDGSYSFLLNLASWWLSVLTVGMIRYRPQDRLEKVDQKTNHRVIAVSTLEEFVKTQTDIHQFIFELTKNRRDQHNEMVNEFRRWEEAKLTMQTAADHDGLLVAMDGTLASFPREYDLMKDVVKQCELHDHMLVGVSKDSELHAFGSSFRDEEVLRKRQREVDGCAFVKAPVEASEKQRRLLYGDIYYARLHPDSPKWFRVDIGTHKDEPETVFANLAAHASARHSIG
jgi:hypothetical protein